VAFEVIYNATDEVLALLNWQHLCEGKSYLPEVSSAAKKGRVNRGDGRNRSTMTPPGPWPQLPKSVIPELERAEELLGLSCAIAQEPPKTDRPDGRDPKRTADTKTDKKKKSSSRIPANDDISRLARKVLKELPVIGSKKEIALDYTDGDKKKAETLLRGLRRYPHLLD
jgi:hypothetical protein